MVVAQLPPGPQGHFLLGNIPDYRRGQLEFLERCSREYGDVVRLRLGYHRIFLVNHPDAIEEVLVTKSRNFIKHFALRLTPLLLGNGLLLSEGDFYLRQRRMVQPAFHRARLATYAPIMVQAAQNTLATWRPGETRDMTGEMMRITLEIAARTLFGSEVARETQEINERLQFLQESYLARFNSFYPIPIWIPTQANLRMRKAIRRLDQIIYRFIDQRRQSGTDRGDLLSLLLHARDEDDGGQMTDRQVRDEAMTLFLAGHETTTLALSWTWYLLATHPEAEERLATEVRAALAGRLPTVDDLPRLRYTEWVVQESMRLYPPVYTIGREALRDCEVGGYRVPKGTTILMNQWIVHRDRRFFEQPEQFAPERWTGDFVHRLPRYAYFPFGGGPRLCPGNNFAMMEAMLILATIAQSYRFTLLPGHQVVPWAPLTLRPAGGVPAIVTRRAEVMRPAA
jgi:cytochrome P450